MGLFRRKKDEYEEPAIESVQESIQIKSPEEIQRDRITNELETINAELLSKEEHLDSINQKLAKAKSEYDEVVGTLMNTKKEINDKKSELDLQQIGRAHV